MDAPQISRLSAYGMTTARCPEFDRVFFRVPKDKSLSGRTGCPDVYPSSGKPISDSPPTAWDPGTGNIGDLSYGERQGPHGFSAFSCPISPGFVQFRLFLLPFRDRKPLNYNRKYSERENKKGVAKRIYKTEMTVRRSKTESRKSLLR